MSEVTGVDLMVTPEGRRKTDVFDFGTLFERLIFGKKDPALEELERLLLASKHLVDIFKDDASLANGMWDVARRRARLPSTVTRAALLVAVRAARDEGPMVHWAYQDPKAKVPKRAPQGANHDALVALLFPPDQFVGPESLDVWNDKRRTVELLIQMADVYDKSFVKDKKGRREPVPADARAAAGEGALPQLVAHGFLNLPEKLVSALRASNGGDLEWLGTSEHTKDFMHFELKTSIAALLTAS